VASPYITQCMMFRIHGREFCVDRDSDTLFLGSSNRVRLFGLERDAVGWFSLLCHVGERADND